MNGEFKKYSKKKSFSISIYNWAIVLSMLPLGYGAVRNGHENFSASINLLTILAIGISVFFVHRISKKMYGKEIWPFLLVVALEIPFQWLFFSNEHYGVRSAFGAWITLGLMVVTVVLLVKDGKGEYIWKVINAISMLGAVCILLQMLCYQVGIRLDRLGSISNLFFKAWEFNNGTLFRPCGLFSEPSHFAEIALLSFYYYLLLQKDMKKAILLGAALIVSTSSLGIIGVVVIVALYILGIEMVENMKSSTKILILVTVFMVCVGVMWWISTTNNVVVQRVLSGGSSSVRMLRSFELFSMLSMEEKVFGIGIQNQEFYLNWHNIILPSDNYETMYQNREFAQTFGYVLCTTGILGLISILIPFGNLAIKGSWRMKSLLVLFLFVCLTCCIFTRATFVIYLLAIFSLQELEGRKKQIYE